MKYYPPYGSSDPDAPYVDRDSSTSTSGSKVPAKAIEKPQRELVDLISKSGGVPDDALQLSAAVRRQRLNWFVAGGTANALTVTPDPAVGTLSGLLGVPFRVLIAATNTAAATLNVNGLGAIAILSSAGDALVAGDLRAGSVSEFVYDGTNFLMMAASPQSQANRALAVGTYSIAAGGLPNSIVSLTLLSSIVTETYDNAGALAAGIYTVPFDGVAIMSISGYTLNGDASGLGLGVYQNGAFVDSLLDQGSGSNKTFRLVYSRVLKVAKNDTLQFGAAVRNAAGTGNAPAMNGNINILII